MCGVLSETLWKCGTIRLLKVQRTSWTKVPGFYGVNQGNTMAFQRRSTLRLCGIGGTNHWLLCSQEVIK